MLSKEKKEQLQMLIRLGVLVACVWLYSAGGCEGMGGKWLRRYLAPIIFSGYMYYVTRHWLSILQGVYLSIASSMGYGADTLFWKIFKRGYCGAFFGFAGTLNKWRKPLVFGYQNILVISGFICFGVFNPFGSARIEETVLGLLIYGLPILSVKKDDYK